MSLHTVVQPSDLQNAQLEHVPISSAPTTASGGVHMGGGAHSAAAAQAHDALAAQTGTADSYCDFAKFQVVPDVLDSNAKTLAKVSYHGKAITMGQTLTVKETQSRPAMEWTASTVPMATGTPALYTVIMCDPDAPSREEPKWRNYLHMILVNVPDCFSLDAGTEIAPYQGPAPPPSTGFHRYCTMIYAQKTAIDASKLKKYSDEQRPKWSLRDWLASHKFEIDGAVPLAGNMFQCANEDQSKRLAAAAVPEQGPSTKADAKADKQAHKDAEKAEKEAEKEAEKHRKEAEKEAEKQRKEAEKEAEKAHKEEEKHRKEAEKEAEKARKEAEKAAK